MDLATIATAMGFSLTGSAAVTYWVAQEVVKTRLQRGLEDHKAQLAQQLETFRLGLNQELERTKSDLQRELARDKALVDGAVRKEVETQLGESAAQRQYELDARRRLYTAIGPLRFQLLLACRDLAARVSAYAQGQRYAMNLNGYYGRSTLYRILRPVAVGELIERQIALADFSIDPSAIDCLRFRRTITRILSGDELPGDHPRLNWDKQEQHVYSDRISSCAQALIDTDEGKRVLQFDEFDALLTQKGAAAVSPFDTLLSGFTSTARPILWIRLVAYANACNELVKRLGGPEFEIRALPIDEMLKHGGDPHTLAHLTDYVARIQSVQLVKL